MLKQLLHQESNLSSNWLHSAYAFLRKWFIKEIIDFDPVDNEVVTDQRIMDQYKRAQSFKERCLMVQKNRETLMG
jgi:hypothetical protein